MKAMRQNFLSLVGLLCMTAACLLLARSNSQGTAFFPSVALDTVEWRQARIEAIRATWEDRERAQTTVARNDERAFVNRLGGIANHIQSTESGRTAASLLHQAYREHSLGPGDFPMRVRSGKWSGW